MIPRLASGFALAWVVILASCYVVGRAVLGVE